ncbi:MAG: hypothetical protein PHV78_03465 [Patescibacteria group bacterium]|nr:hypothetical protein [Patescibacteria group bacterium]MDD5121554.1 hypothetical protein [Patescibacteria group bacterium]MDD5222058.1 hypothetical protein [Patescibacteria group bacterium]MDD5396282.1 hypothetical protein [Patescibacteria group bacterium]
MNNDFSPTDPYGPSSAESAELGKLIIWLMVVIAEWMDKALKRLRFYATIAVLIPVTLVRITWRKITFQS